MPDYNTGKDRAPRPPRGPGKGPKANCHTIRLYPRDKVMADEVAKIEKISLNEVIRRAIRLYHKETTK